MGVLNEKRCKKSLRIKVNLANYDCITGLLNKLKVAQIQFLTPTQ